jgi:hypothetical protein
MFQIHPTCERWLWYLRPDRVSLDPGLDAGEDQGREEAGGRTQLQHLLPDVVRTRPEDETRPQSRKSERSEFVHDASTEGECGVCSKYISYVCSTVMFIRNMIVQKLL